MYLNEAQPVITRSCAYCGNEIQVTDRDWSRQKGRLIHDACLVTWSEKDPYAPVDK